MVRLKNQLFYSNFTQDGKKVRIQTSLFEYFTETNISLYFHERTEIPVEFRKSEKFSETIWMIWVKFSSSKMFWIAVDSSEK